MVHKADEECDDLFVKSGKEKPETFERKQAEYKDLSKKFINTKSDYSKQFSHIYSARLTELREALIPRVKAKWGMFINSFFMDNMVFSNGYDVHASKVYKKKIFLGIT